MDIKVYVSSSDVGTDSDCVSHYDCTKCEVSVELSRSLRRFFLRSLARIICPLRFNNVSCGDVSRTCVLLCCGICCHALSK